MAYLRFLLGWLTLIFAFPNQGLEGSPPYIYYYSSARNAFIVERTDGSDSRVFGADLLPGDTYYVSGLGWSPDGKRFAVSKGQSGRPSGYVIDPTISNPVFIIEMWDGGPTAWSPDGTLLLVVGNIDPCMPGCPHQTTWLVNVTRGHIVAWLDIRRDLGGAGTTPVEWDLAHGEVRFYRQEENLGRAALSHYYQIVMSVDGRVVKNPISREDYFSVFVPAEDSDIFADKVSPSGRYVITTSGQLTDTQTNVTMQLPQPEFPIDRLGTIVDIWWNTSETWALVGYDLGAGSVGGISVVDSQGRFYRTLTSCGSSQACFGWLPTSVDVSTLDPLVRE